jgi:hypothetical protein
MPVTPRKKPLLRDQVMAQFAGPGPARKPSKEAVREAMQAGPQRKSELLGQVTAKHHLTRTGVNWAIGDLVERGELTESADGIIALPVTKPPPAPAARPAKGIDVILDVLSDGAEHSRSELRSAFARSPFKAKGFDARLHEAFKRGLAVKLDNGHIRQLKPGDMIEIATAT